MEPRYHVVWVQRFLDGPPRIRAVMAYAVADHQEANRCVTGKFATFGEAQAVADRLNAGGVA